MTWSWFCSCHGCVASRSHLRCVDPMCMHALPLDAYRILPGSASAIQKEGPANMRQLFGSGIQKVARCRLHGISIVSARRTSPSQTSRWQRSMVEAYIGGSFTTSQLSARVQSITTSQGGQASRVAMVCTKWLVVLSSARSMSVGEVAIAHPVIVVIRSIVCGLTQ